MKAASKRWTIRSIVVLWLVGPGAVSASEDSALYWSISREGQAVGKLLGTIHSEDPRVLDFPPGFIEELTANEVFAMEIVPDLPTLKRLTDFMQYTDGSSLESFIGAERFSRLNAVLSNYKLPPDWITRMKIWAAVLTLSVPPPESGFFMDFSLSLRAAGAGLEVVGLETLEQQLSFLEDMPLEQQLQLLDQALEDYAEVEESHRAMVASYLEGNLAGLMAQAEEQLDRVTPEAKTYFMEYGVDRRNEGMIKTVMPYLEARTVFIAVGALHLPGDKGLVAQLRSRGFTLEPLPSPFNVETQE